MEAIGAWDASICTAGGQAAEPASGRIKLDPLFANIPNENQAQRTASQALTLAPHLSTVYVSGSHH